MENGDHRWETLSHWLIQTLSKKSRAAINCLFLKRLQERTDKEICLGVLGQSYYLSHKIKLTPTYYKGLFTYFIFHIKLELDWGATQPESCPKHQSKKGARKHLLLQPRQDVVTWKKCVLTWLLLEYWIWSEGTLSPRKEWKNQRDKLNCLLRRWEVLAAGFLLCANLGPELNCSGLQRRGRALLPNSTLIPLSLSEGMPNYSFAQGSHQSWCGPGGRATCRHGLYLFCSGLFTKRLAQCQPEHSP